MSAVAGSVSGVDGALVVVGLEQHAAEDAVAVVATSEPDDGLRDDLTPQDVSPGLLGFAVIFAAAVACIPLFLSMTRKLRKVDPRREKDAADRREAPAEEESPDEGASAEEGGSPGEGAIAEEGGSSGEGDTAEEGGSSGGGGSPRGDRSSGGDKSPGGGDQRP